MIIMILVLVVLIIWGVKLAISSYGFDLLGLFMVIIFGVTLLVLSLMWIANYSDTYAIEQRKESIEFSVNSLTTNGEFEHLSLDNEIIDFNKSLASYKKWNEHWLFSMSINDIVDELEYIEYRKLKEE